MGVFYIEEREEEKGTEERVGDAERGRKTTNDAADPRGYEKGEKSIVILG